MKDATPEVVEDMLFLSDLPYYARVLTEAFNAANTGEIEAPEVKTETDPPRLQPSSTNPH